MQPINRLWPLALACASAGFLAFSIPAAAYEPMPESIPTQWGGFYVGGQIGGAWSETDWRYKNPNWFNTLGPNVVITNFDLDRSGVLGGGQAGFNYQSGAWVFGIEGSVAGADLSDSRPSPFFPAIDRYGTNISWLATVTGRLGYARDRWLVYGKGGWAGADVELTLFDRIALVRAKSDTWANGWTVGGGAEYALGQSLSLAVEYDYADLGTGRWTVRCNCPSGVGGRDARGRRRCHGSICHGAAQLPLRQIERVISSRTRGQRSCRRASSDSRDRTGRGSSRAEGP